MKTFHLKSLRVFPEDPDYENFVYATTIVLGGYKPIDNPNDPTVIEIAKFAVDEHNKEAKTNLKFQRVVKGEKQLVHGLNYKLVISAVDGAAAQNYVAVVYDKPWENFSLTSFEKYSG
ncbi:Cysteine proteinase inhibitor 5 [Forsythia ovata]|uniref:Cysteine proteinase inhibitor 5 n=1 Tax=Forsythia ovata TaxID=205694 RepID=A0ABD1QBD6_9LAMI